MEKVKKFLSATGQYLKHEKKKVLLTPLFIVILAGISSSVLVSYHLLNNNQISVSPTPISHMDTVSGEVAGASTENTPPTPTPKNQNAVKKPTTSPTPTPQSSNTSTQASNNNSSNNTSNNNSNQSTNNPSSTPTSTPEPTAEPTLTSTPEPSPSPTPDTSPFDATMTTEGNTAIVTGNKSLQKCKWVEANPSGGIVTSNNGDGADLINGNVCTIVRNNLQLSVFGVKVTSIYGEEKILGSSPPNYW